MLIFVIVATEPALVLFAAFALYACSGPINTFRMVDKVKLEDVVGDADNDPESDITLEDVIDGGKAQKSTDGQDKKN